MTNDLAFLYTLVMFGWLAWLCFAVFLRYCIKSGGEGVYDYTMLFLAAMMFLGLCKTTGDVIDVTSNAAQCTQQPAPSKFPQPQVKKMT